MSSKKNSKRFRSGAPRRSARVGATNKRDGSSQTWSIFELKPAFPGQQVTHAWMLADPIKLTTTVTTGLIASSITLSSALISNFATRVAMWDEYRITRVKIEVFSFSTNNPGLVRAWVEPRSNTTPTLAIAEASEGIAFSAADVSRPHCIDYKINDPVLIDFTQINAAQTIGFLNVFTNNANYGSSIVATDYLSIHMRCGIQFRGLA